MKKILISILLIFSVFAFFIPDSFSAECTYDGNIKNSLDSCLKTSELVNWKNVEVKAWWWFQKQVMQWTKNISLYLWVFAVWAIVFWGLMLVFSVWEEEKIKKWKNIVKWWIIWFIWIISASAIISLIVKIMYSI